VGPRAGIGFILQIYFGKSGVEAEFHLTKRGDKSAPLSAPTRRRAWHAEIVFLSLLNMTEGDGGCYVYIRILF
jgi:hypothetical protein